MHGHYSLPTHVSYFPQFDSHHVDQVGDFHTEEPILRNGTSAVRCEWAEVDKKSTRKIRDTAAPAFPLLSAWLKPEAGALDCLLKRHP